MENKSGKNKDPDKFVEKDKRGKLDPYTKIPKQGRIRCKVFNLDSPGMDIQGCLNGVIFSIQHGQVVDLHPSQIEVLQNAKIETTEYDEIVPGEKFDTRNVIRPRFMVEIMGVVKEKTSIPGEEKVISGRG